MSAPARVRVGASPGVYVVAADSSLPVVNAALVFAQAARALGVCAVVDARPDVRLRKKLQDSDLWLYRAIFGASEVEAGVVRLRFRSPAQGSEDVMSTADAIDELAIVLTAGDLPSRSNETP